ncbi:uncharacterized protein LOC135489040 isoform X2 [Lineus longissimus]|uniref:uncharacterized protein LOC135489040 isoform X2 n=1 Tax=Lineus longissimus TaxID=88925 RepID=UPI00315CD8E1
MAGRMYGRLPRLQTIGKGQSVDSDEPPDTGDSDNFDSTDTASDNDDIIVASRQSSARQQLCLCFEPEDACDAAKTLGKSFRVLNPKAHVCMRNRTYGASFTHCQRSISLSKSYSQLRKLLEGRARVQLVRDYTSRIHALSLFVDEVEGLVSQEYTTWHAIVHNDQEADPPSTNLEYLSCICEDLRVHIYHWNSVKQRIHTERWLSAHLPSLCHELDFVRVTLTKLRDKALWLIDKLIRIGLQVFAHLDQDSISHECLWSITRGIEEFNSIISFIRSTHVTCPYETFSRLDFLRGRHRFPTSVTKQNWHPFHSNNLGVRLESVKAVPFTRILNTIANERSKYAATLTRDFFTMSEELLNKLKVWKIQEYPWAGFIGEEMNRSNLHGKSDTSDYHSATGSQASLSSSLLKVGSTEAPNLSTSHSSPLLHFMQREHDFAVGFLSAVCQCTNLLRRSASKGSEHSPKKKPHLRSGGSDPTVNNQKDPSKRKSVSWGDTADTNVKAQLLNRYMDTLWQCFSNFLFDFFFHHTWGDGNMGEQQVGHIHQCPSTVILMVVQMMKQTSVKDLFPPGAVPSILMVTRKLQGHAAIASWDTMICTALASGAVDKCYPIPLIHNEYCTRTGKELRDCYQPLTSVLSMVQQSPSDRTTLKNSGPNSLMMMQLVQLPLLHAAMLRLITTTQLVLNWCTTKSYQFMAARSAGSFLLIIQSDAKLLADEITKALQMSQPLCEPHSKTALLPDTNFQADLLRLLQQLNNKNGQLQTLSGQAMKSFGEDVYRMSLEFFEECMPTGKLWKQKANQNFPSEVNPYVQQALDRILEPVVDGVSKLKTTAQLGAISMAVTKMCEAWTSFILKEKIKFSLYGAYQLQVDFEHVRIWLDAYLENEEVKQSILALDILKYLNGAVLLLKRQPPRNAGKGKESRTDERSVEYSTNATEQTSGSTESGSQSGSAQLSISSDGSGQKNDLELDDYTMPNTEDWLALRVHGGSRNWKFSSCFNP